MFHASRAKTDVFQQQRFNFPKVQRESFSALAVPNLRLKANNSQAKSPAVLVKQKKHSVCFF